MRLGPAEVTAKQDVACVDVGMQAKSLFQPAHHLPSEVKSRLGIDRAVPAMVQSLEFARTALAAGKIGAAMDALGVNIGIANAILGKLPARETPAAATASIDMDEVNELTLQDIENVKSVITRMAKAEIIDI